MKSQERHTKIQEIEDNFEYFKPVIPTLMKKHHGRYALLKNKEIIGLYDTVRDAQMTGEIFYKDGLFSVQNVETQPIDLGIFSRTLHLAQPQKFSVTFN